MEVERDGLRVVFKHWRYRTPTPQELWAALDKLIWSRNRTQCVEPCEVIQLFLPQLEHYRKGLTDWEPHPRGGATTAYVYVNGEMMAKGYSECSPVDSFRYETHRRIAAGRALKELGYHVDKKGMIAKRRGVVPPVPQGRTEVKYIIVGE